MSETTMSAFDYTREAIERRDRRVRDTVDRTTSVTVHIKGGRPTIQVETSMGNLTPDAADELARRVTLASAMVQHAIDTGIAGPGAYTPAAGSGDDTDA